MRYYIDTIINILPVMLVAFAGIWLVLWTLGNIDKDEANKRKNFQLLSLLKQKHNITDNFITFSILNANILNEALLNNKNWLSGWMSVENNYLVLHLTNTYMDEHTNIKTGLEYIGKYQIELNNIVYYTQQNNIQKSNKNNGINLNGAISGAIIGGGIGAIIGSRNNAGTEFNMGYTILKFIDKSSEKHLIFSPTEYSKFLKLMPEKEYSVAITENAKSLNITDQIEKLYNLKLQGALTSQEYDKQKRILLNEI